MAQRFVNDPFDSITLQDDCPHPPEVVILLTTASDLKAAVDHELAFIAMEDSSNQAEVRCHEALQREWDDVMEVLDE